MNRNIPYISREQTEKLLNCFAEAIENPASQPLLFNVWGIGGVGKTTLLDKLQEQHPNIAFARVYFGTTPDIGTPLKLMANLYSQLPTIYDWGAEFESFTELYRQYEQTLEQLKDPDRKENEAQTTTRKDEIKKLVGGGAKTIIQATPLKNTGAEDKIALIAEGTVDLVDWLQKQRVTGKNKELQALMLKPIPNLTEAFVRGLIAKSKRQPVVLLLDTYEKTNSEIDNWLRQYLIANSSLKSYAVRIFVAGRRNLQKQKRWRKLEQDFNSVVYRLEIEKFNLEQTQRYSEDIGIDESEAIYQVTKGLPYYLNWILEQKKKEKELDFSQGNQEIINLLLQGLNQAQKKVIQLASCCRSFNQSLIKYLTTSQKLDFEKEVDTELNCFEWLVKLDFVGFSQNTHNLDDVARDVFRISLWKEDSEKFREVHDLLAQCYEDKAIEQVPPNSSPRQMYENLEWKEYTAESLYYTLFARQEDCEINFISYLFTACYFQETEVVTIPFNSITAEINLENDFLLSSSVKNFLQNIKPIFDVNCLAFEERRLVDSLNNQELSLEQVKTFLKPALEYCFNRVDSLAGLAKFAALLYKAKNSPSSCQLRYLQQAQAQAEKIIVNSDPEFSSGLFLWDLGNTFVDLGRLEEAIASYNKALEIKPGAHEAWYSRGLVLVNLGRLEEAIVSYDKALEIKPNDDATWEQRGVALMTLARYEDAFTSYDRALELNPNNTSAWYNCACCFALQNQIETAIENLAKAILLNYECREMAKTDAYFDNIREDSRFQSLINSQQ